MGRLTMEVFILNWSLILLLFPGLPGPFCSFPTMDPHQKVPDTCGKLLGLSGHTLGQFCLVGHLHMRRWTVLGVRWRNFIFFPFSSLYYINCIKVLFHWRSYALQYVLFGYGKWQNHFRESRFGGLHMLISLLYNKIRPLIPQKSRVPVHRPSWCLKTLVLKTLNI